MLPANPAYLEPPREITRDHPLTVRPKPTWLLTWALSSPACIAPFAPSPLPTTLLGPPSPPWRCTLGARSFALSPCGLRMCAADRVDAHRHGALAAPRSSSRRRRLLVQLGRLLCRTLSLFSPSKRHHAFICPATCTAAVGALSKHAAVSGSIAWSTPFRTCCTCGVVVCSALRPMLRALSAAALFVCLFVAWLGCPLRRLAVLGATVSQRPFVLPAFVRSAERDRHCRQRVDRRQPPPVRL